LADHGQTPAAGRETAWQALANRRMLICVFIGFSSGMPLYLLLNLLSAWLRTEGVSLEVIGLFALAQFPYTWKFLWAPLLDRYALPLLGRRRSWMAATQLGLLIAIVWLGQLAPQNLAVRSTWQRRWRLQRTPSPSPQCWWRFCRHPGRGHRRLPARAPAGRGTGPGQRGACERLPCCRPGAGRCP